MSRPSDAPANDRRPPVFPIACWALGLMALAQLWVGGVALAARLQASREVRVVEKEVTRIVAVPARPEVTKPAAEPVVVRSPKASPPPPSGGVPMKADLPPPTPLRAPPIANPQVEQLVNEAKGARVRGDMGLAVQKLEEAQALAADEAAVVFEMGETLEIMGVFDRASDYFEKVMGMGATKAGSLYQRAASKLELGFLPEPVTGKVRLGKVRAFKNPEHPDGFQVQLSVPVEKAPDAEVVADDLDVVIEVFNHSKRGGIEPADKSWVAAQESSKVWDWQEGPEMVRAIYLMPGHDPARSELAGGLEYYGQVVTLLYRGEVVDVDPWPRDLAVRSSLRAQPEVYPGGDGSLLPPDDGGDIVLPPLNDPGGMLPPPR